MKLKIILLGSCGVGKTSIINKFVYNKFIIDHEMTIGVDIFTKDIIEDKIYRIDLYDTAGYSDYKTITKSYYNYSDAILYIYDISNIISFQEIEKYIIETKSYNCKKILIGNKCDILKKDVSIKDGLKLAKKYDLQFFECNCKNDSVNDIILNLCNDLNKSNIEQYIDESDLKDTKKWCCF